jgi:N-methylhydantoinase A/oxoprolinase/acetone carboxylase beta subunit
VWKELSTPGDQSPASSPVWPAKNRPSIANLRIGTTVTTNAILERKVPSLLM